MKNRPRLDKIPPQDFSVSPAPPCCVTREVEPRQLCSLLESLVSAVRDVDFLAVYHADQDTPEGLGQKLSIPAFAS